MLLDYCVDLFILFVTVLFAYLLAVCLYLLLFGVVLFCWRMHLHVCCVFWFVYLLVCCFVCLTAGMSWLFDCCLLCLLSCLCVWFAGLPSYYAV